MPINFDYVDAKEEEKKNSLNNIQQPTPEVQQPALTEEQQQNIKDVYIGRSKVDELNQAVNQIQYNDELNEAENLSNYWQARSKIENLEEDFKQNDYKLELDPGVWEAISGVIGNTAATQGITEAEELSYKYASAIKLSQGLNISVSEALDSLDDLTTHYYGDEYKDYKSKYKAITDSFTLGVNTLRESKLGNMLEEYERFGMTEEADQVWKKIEALDEYSNSLQDTMPRKWVTEALKSAAQTLPYTAAVAAPSILAGIVAPGIGGLAGFAAGFDVTYGTEYIELRRAGADQKTASAVASLSAAGQAAVEQLLGTIANTSGNALAAVGKKTLQDTILEKGMDKAAEQIGKALFSRFHFGELGYKAIAKGLLEYGENALEEGVEEALQSYISAGGKYLASYLSDQDIDLPNAEQMWSDAVTEAKGAILGALVLGIPDANFSAAATAKDFVSVKNAAILSDSKEDFIKTMQTESKAGSSEIGAQVFAGMDNDQIKAAAGKVYDQYAKERNNREEELTKKYNELYTTEEGIEKLAVDEESGETEAVKSEYRADNGALYTQDEIKSVDEDGKQHGTYQAGDKESGKNYGYIKYTVDNDNSTVTIDSYKMAEHRDYLRRELFENFAEQYSDYDIQWNAKDQAADFKQSLINANPRGKEAGLNFYTSEESKEDVQARIEVARQIRDNFNFKTDREVYTATAVFEALAKGQDKSLSQFFNDTFNGSIFGDRQVLEDAARRQNAVDVNGNVLAKGGININDDIKSSIKAVIYTSDKSDMSTWLHELTHLWRKMLTGEQLDKLNEAMGITDGNWTEDLDEKLAELAETAYGRGLIKNNDLKGVMANIQDLLSNLAEFIYRLVDILRNRGEISDALLEQFNEMLKGDDNLLAKAARAVKEADTDKTQKEIKDKENNTYKETKKDLTTRKEDLIRSSEDTELANQVQQTENIIKDPEAAKEEKVQSAVNESVSLAEAAANMEVDETIDFFQLAGRSVISQDPRLSRSFLQFISMKKSGEYTTQDIKKATGWEQDEYGNVWHEEDNLNFKNEQVQKDIEGLLKDGEKYRNAIITLKPLKEIIADNEAMLYPGMGDSTLYLMNLEGNKLDAVYVPGSNAIVINTARVKDGWTFMQSLTNGIQQAILKNEGMMDVDTQLLQDLITQNARVITQLKKTGQYIDPAIMQEVAGLFTEYLTSPVGRLSYEVSQRYAKNEKPSTLFFNPQTQARQLQFQKRNQFANNNNDTSISFEKAKEIYPNIVDLSETFDNPAPTEKEIGSYLNKLYKNKDYITLTPDKKIRFYKSENKNKHIYAGENYKTDNNKTKKTKRRISSKIEELVNNAVYRDSSLIKDGKEKSTLSGYHYFTVPVYINGHGYEVLLQAEVPEDNKKASSFSSENEPGLDTYAGSQEYNNILLKKLQAKSISYLYNFRDNGILFQKDTKDMYAIHNLSEANLRHVIKMGGIANPSMAVTDLDHPFSNFGEISLIPNPTILTKEGKNAGTYGADIYSPRYPRLTVNIKSEGEKTISSIFSGITNEELQKDLVNKVINEIENNEDPRYMKSFKVPFLLDKGYKEDDFYVYTKGNYTGEELKDFKENVKSKYVSDLTAEEKQYLTDLFFSRPDIVKRFEGMTEEEKKEYKESFLEDGMLNFNLIRDLYSQINYDIEHSGKIDRIDTINKADNIIEEKDLKNEYENYIKDKLNSIEKEEKIFTGFTPSGNRKYIAHTLENVSKYMKAEALRGGEGDYGLGSTRAKFTPKFTNLKQIKAAKDRLVNKETFETIKKDFGETYEKIQELLAGDNGWDVGAARFEEAYTQRQQNPINYLEDEYGLNISEEDAAMMNDFVSKLAAMPTEYFETKFTRPVYLNEFNVAVIPSNLDPELKKVLEDNGLNIQEYDPSGDRSEAQRQAIEEAATKRNILFQTDFFNKDINQTDDLQYQTESELLNDAATFDTWQDFMEYYEVFGSDAIPDTADATWYENLWSRAKEITSTEEKLTAAKNETIAEDQAENDEDQDPIAMDALFITALKSRAGMLEGFLSKIQEIKDEDYIEAVDEEEAAENEKLRILKDYISKYVKHATVKSYAKGLSSGKTLDDRAINKIANTMGSSARAYRALYADIMQDNAWKVRESDTIEAQIKANAEELKKLKGIESDINIDVLSAEERTKIAKKLQNEILKEKVKEGTILAASDYDSLIKNLESEIKDKENEIEKAERDYQDTLNSISDYEQRDILKKYEELLKAKAKYDKKSTTAANHAEAAVKTAERYKSGAYQDEIGTYNGIYRRYKDAIKLVKVTEEVKYAQQLLDKQQQIKDEVRERKAEQSEIQKLKELRKRLVKRTMRRVNFKTVDYDHARILIAIQRMFEPNLEGGVNRWIGTEGRYARQVWSEYYTDEEARNKIRKQLDYAGSGPAQDLLQLLEKTKSEDDFASWTNKQRQAVYKYLPKEDWIQELKLIELDKEREESIQLPLTERTYTRTFTGEDGKKHKETLYRMEPSPELAKEIQDAIGVNMYNDLTFKDFAEWTTNDMEQLARKIDDFYVEGKELLEAKKKARKELAAELRSQILSAVKNTGIVINEDDTPEEKKRKQAKIDKILGYTDQLKGTAADSYKRKNFFNTILHGYFDANVRRVARILDNQSESVNTSLLYWGENNSYINQEKNKERRTQKVTAAMEKAGISVEDLYEKIELPRFYPDGRSITLSKDELLFYYQAQFDQKSKEAVMYGSMMDIKDRQKYIDEDKEYLDALDQADEESIEAFIKGDTKSREEAIQNKIDLLKKAGLKEQFDKIKADHPGWSDDRIRKEVHLRTPGTEAYKADCERRYALVLSSAEKVLQEKGYKDFVNAIAEDYAAEFERLSRVSIEVFNAPVARVENYVPLVRLSLTGDTNEAKVKADLLAQTSEAGNRAGVDKGMTQKRIYIGAVNQMPVEAGLYKTWADQVERTEHFIAYADYTRLLRDVYGSRDAQSMNQWIESRYGKGMKSYIQDYINEVANPESLKSRSSIDHFVRAMRGKTAPAYLSWKMSSILKQAVTSPMPYMQFISPVEYIGSVIKYIAHPNQMEEAIKSKSIFMKNRRFDPIADVISEEMSKQNNPKIVTLWNRFSNLGMQGLEFIDWACVAPGWQAIYKKEYKRLSKEAEDLYQSNLKKAKENTPLWNAKSEEELDLIAKDGVMTLEEIEQAAVNKADDCVRLSQPSNRVSDISPLFKTKGTGNEIVKALLQFTMSLNIIWQNIRYDLPYAIKNAEYKQAVGMIAGYTLAGIGLEMLAGSVPTGDDDEEERNAKIKKLIYGATTQFTDAMPIIGSTISAMDEKLITGESKFSSGSDLFPTLTKFIQGTTAVSSGDWEKACKRYAEGVGMTIGAPVSGIKEVMAAFGLDDDEEGIEVHPEAFLGQR